MERLIRQEDARRNDPRLGLVQERAAAIATRLERHADGRARDPAPVTSRACPSRGTRLRLAVGGGRDRRDDGGFPPAFGLAIVARTQRAHAGEGPAYRTVPPGRALNRTHPVKPLNIVALGLLVVLGILMSVGGYLAVDRGRRTHRTDQREVVSLGHGDLLRGRDRLRLLEEGQPPRYWGAGLQGPRRGCHADPMCSSEIVVLTKEDEEGPTPESAMNAGLAAWIEG